MSATLGRKDGFLPCAPVDENGQTFGLKQISNKIRVSSMPYLYDIAEGNVPNHTVWQKSGYNEALSSTEEDIWSVGGSYVFPAAEQQMEVVSSSANDASAGTGIQKVKIWFLDDEGTEYTEEVTLNGVTPVPTTATNIYRINHLRASAVGTGGVAAGTIDIRNLADTPIYSRIGTGMTRARQVIYTVPKDKYLFITSVTVSGGSTVAGRLIKFTTRATYDSLLGTRNTWFNGYTEIYLQDGVANIPLEMPTRFPQLTDIKVSAISPDGATSGSCILRGWEETA